MDFSKDYYKVLNLDKFSTSKEVRKSYYKLSFVHHPDRGGDSSIFNTITDAYNILMDIEQRKEYDTRSIWGNSYDETLDFLDFEFSSESTGWSEDKFNDFKNKERLNLIHYIDDTFNGSVEYDRWVICKECKGSGKDLKSKIEIKDSKGNILKIFDPEDGCDFCEGSGSIDGQSCTFCFGEGKVGSKNCKLCNGDKRVIGKQKLSGIKITDDQKDHKIDFMGNFSKDIPGKVGHLWIVRK